MRIRGECVALLNSIDAKQGPDASIYRGSCLTLF